MASLLRCSILQHSEQPLVWQADLPELMFLKEWPAHDMSVDEFRNSSSQVALSSPGICLSPEKMNGEQ